MEIQELVQKIDETYGKENFCDLILGEGEDYDFDENAPKSEQCFEQATGLKFSFLEIQPDDDETSWYVFKIDEQCYGVLVDTPASSWVGDSISCDNVYDIFKLKPVKKTITVYKME